jgi:hypothetical protein
LIGEPASIAASSVGSAEMGSVEPGTGDFDLARYYGERSR